MLITPTVHGEAMERYRSMPNEDDEDIELIGKRHIEPNYLETIVSISV